MTPTSASPAIGAVASQRLPAQPPPPPPPPPPGHQLPYTPNVRLRFANALERTFGRAYLPIAVAGGAALGGGLGFLTLGPFGGIAGAVGGALLAGVLVFAG